MWLTTKTKIGLIRATSASLLTGTLVVSGSAAAHADKPTVISEDSTGFACEYFPEGRPQVNVSINYDAIAGNGYSHAEVLSPDGELHVADGYTDAVTVGDGVVTARYPLINEDGSDAGEVVLEGTYTAIADPLTLRNRFPVTRNSHIIGTLVYTELEVDWTTIHVGDFDVSGLSCAGQRSTTMNRVLNPHRLTDTFREIRTLGPCAQPPLTQFEVVGSEVGVSLALAAGDLFGSTNLALGDGSDTQPVEWYAEGGQEPTEITSITMTLTEQGRSRSVVRATSERLVLEQIQPLTLAFELVLPRGEGTVTASCAAESVVTRVAVEPVA